MNIKTNEELQKDVQDAIKWEPLLSAAEIGVIVKDGIVTLSGIVDSRTKKLEAEMAAKNVEGVKAVVEKIETRIPNIHVKDDNDIAIDVLNFLRTKLHISIDSDKVKIRVENGWVILDGELQWNYQKEVAQKAIEDLMGVVGVTNNIIIKSETIDEIEKRDIESALRRNWAIDDKDINVNVMGNQVTLLGTVKSLYQKEEAERIAWNAPGVSTVLNEIDVEFNY